MKRIWICTMFCLATGLLYAETDYEKRSKQVQVDIWGANDADFASNEVPSQYKNESAVILAKKYDISAQSKSHFKVGLLNFATSKEIIFQYLLHEKVVLQDKASIEDFSEISYQKVSKRSIGTILIRFKDKISTYIGAKVYKKDGSVKEVLMSEAVVVKNGNKPDEEKLAIPDLQVGDILDFYILSEENRELSSLDPMTFLFASEYPIVRFSLQGKISKKYGVEYKCMNSAPDLKIEKDEDDNMNFAVKVFHVKKYAAEQWINPIRQVPVVKLNIFLNNSKFKAGQISKGVTEKEIFQDEKTELVNAAQTYKYTKAYSSGFGIDDRMKELKKKFGKDIPNDSVIVAVYNGLRSYIYFRLGSSSKVAADKSVNNSAIQNKLFCQYLSYSLADYGIENDVIFYPSRYMTRFSDMLTTDNVAYVVRATGSKSYYMYDDGMFTTFNQIPEYAEGEKAITLTYGKMKDIIKAKEDNITQSSIEFPISGPAQNKHLENIVATLSLATTPSVSLKRQTTLSGHHKMDEQKSLLLFEDYYNDFRKDMDIKKHFLTELEESKKTKNLAEEWHNAFTKARETYKDGFMSDLKSNYGSEPKELASYKVEKMGILKNDADFQYSTESTYQDWLKKAGNNYLFEAGKLIGSQLKIDDAQRTRTVDIHEPFARSYEYDISVAIPEGYSVEGLDALNKKVENETGKFVSTASMEGNTIHIKTYKEYAHNYEPTENWNKLLAFIDAANDFTNQKVLLKKK